MKKIYRVYEVVDSPTVGRIDGIGGGVMLADLGGYNDYETEEDALKCVGADNDIQTNSHNPEYIILPVYISE